MNPDLYAIFEANPDTPDKMVIQVKDDVISKLERSQDEYMRKVSDCSIIIAEREKTVNDTEFVREFNGLLDKFQNWQTNKEFIKSECVIPAIKDQYAHNDTDRFDASWLVNYDRSNKIYISEIHKVAGDVVLTADNFATEISKVKEADFKYTIVCDIYKDLCDRGLKTDKNYNRVEELGSLRTEYSIEKRDAQMDFFTNYVEPVLKEAGFTSYDNLNWECEYTTGVLRIIDTTTNTSVASNLERL